MKSQRQVPTTDHSTSATNEIAALLAHEAIRQCLARYCHGVDRGDRDMILSAYHPGAHDDHGGYSGDAEGFAEYIIAKYDQAPSIGQHHVTNVVIDLRGEQAKVMSYFIAFNPGRVEMGGHDLVGGRYLDDFELRETGWRIASRRVVIDVTRDQLAGDPWPSGLFAEGARHKDDPSVGFFGDGFREAFKQDAC